MKLPLILLFLCCSISCQSTASEYPPSLDRIHYLLEVKRKVLAEHWPTLPQEELPVTMAYFTQEGTFILKPSENILRQFENTPVETPFGFEVVRLSDEAIDTNSFQMQTSYSFEDSSALYFQNHTMMVSDFEVIQQFIPDITDLDDWGLMPVHELFHGVHRADPLFERAERETVSDEIRQFLQTLYAESTWFKEAVVFENEQLIQAWKNPEMATGYLEAFQKSRDNRLKRLEQESGKHFGEAEDLLFRAEGGARHFEILVKQALQKGKAPVHLLSQADQAKVQGFFSEYDLMENTGIYELRNDKYFYVLGVNLHLVFSLIKPEYRRTVFTHNQTFDSLLEEHLNQTL